MNPEQRAGGRFAAFRPRLIPSPPSSTHAQPSLSIAHVSAWSLYSVCEFTMYPNCAPGGYTMQGNELYADLIVSLVEGTRGEVEKLSPRELDWQADAEGNSIGVTVWHVSRWL